MERGARYLVLFAAGVVFVVAAILGFGTFGTHASVLDVLGAIAIGLVLLVASMFP